jgi:two-component system chemotaxis response regulator CheB
MTRIKVLVVDDSAVVRQVISGVLSEDRSIHVIAAVADPIFAMQRMRMDWPDVIVLDVEMPRMDGITFLKKISTAPAASPLAC